LNFEPPSAVRIVEVGPRDGLQNEKDIVPVETKVAFINQLGRSGLRDIEATSFVRAGAVAQLADAAEVLELIEKPEGVRYSVLIPNLRGLERWLECVDSIPVASRSIALFTAASESFNRRNVSASISDSLMGFGEIIDRLRTELGSHLPFIRGYISTAFRCPYEGWIEPERVERVAGALVDLGVDELSLADTIGAATPKQVERLLVRLIPAFGAGKLAMHFHDTRGTALANVVVSLQLGISTFDSSAAGLGGCPFAPGATGNLATEDLVYMLNGLGIENGVDLSQIVHASNIVRHAINHSLPSKELQAFRAAGY